jgi:UTP-glucose-1-phosphate uridylyltransferase
MLSDPARPRLAPEQRREILKADEQWIGKAFNVQANPAAIQANTRYMTLMLLDTKLEQRASRAAQFAEQLMDAIMYEHATPPIACSKGCMHCCTTYVSATIPEILHLANSVGRTIVRKERVMQAAAQAKATPQVYREVKRIICPMLENNACSEYAHRAVSCRYLLSKSLDTCIKILQRGEPAEFQFVDNIVAIRSFVIIMMKTALHLVGLPGQFYELNQALAIAVSTPNAEARWLAGEPLFASVDVDRADQGPSPIHGMVEHLAKVIAPTI